MQLYLDDFAASLPLDVVALLVLDGASWHRSPKLTVPNSLRLVFLPPYTPELNPAEHLVLDKAAPPEPVRWPLLRKVTANQTFADIDALEQHLAERCIWLSDNPGTVASSTSFHGYSYAQPSRQIRISHETVRVWCAKFGPDLAEALRHRKPRRGRSWHLDEMRVVLSGVTHWLQRAVNEHGDILDVLLQEHRDAGAAKRFFRRLIDDQELPERIVTDGLGSYGAAIREMPELSASEHVTVSAAERQNNLDEQSHRPTRDQERQQRGFRGITRAQGFLFTHAEVTNLFRHTRARTSARLRRRNWLYGFDLWEEVSLSIA